MSKEVTGKRVRTQAGWLMANLPKIQKAIAAVAASALTQSPDKKPRKKAIKK